MGKKILVVDDEPQLLRMLKTRLAANGYDVVTAEDGTSGLERWQTEKPDLILLDIMMPQMDGYTFIQESKGRSDLNPVPIIIITAREGMEDLFQMEGINDYIVKPFNDADLLKKIRKHLKN